MQKLKLNYEYWNLIFWWVSEIVCLLVDAKAKAQLWVLKLRNKYPYYNPKRYDAKAKAQLWVLKQ